MSPSQSEVCAQGHDDGMMSTMHALLGGLTGILEQQRRAHMFAPLPLIVNVVQHRIQHSTVRVDSFTVVELRVYTIRLEARLSNHVVRIPRAFHGSFSMWSSSLRGTCSKHCFFFFLSVRSTPTQELVESSVLRDTSSVENLSQVDRLKVGDGTVQSTNVVRS